MATCRVGERCGCCGANIRVGETSKFARTSILTTSSSRTTARSSGAAPRWLASNRSTTRPLSSPASNSPTAFARTNSRLGVADVAVAGRGKPNGRCLSREPQDCGTPDRVSEPDWSADAPEPVSVVGASIDVGDVRLPVFVACEQCVQVSYPTGTRISGMMSVQRLATGC